MSDDVKRDYAALLGMLAPTPKREAIASPRGYDWQKWLTVERWVALKQDERLWVEWAEDLTVAAPTGAFTIQAKDRDGEITLGQAPVIELIDLAIKRGAKVKTVIWTRATAGHERGRPFGEPGIVHWKRVVAGEADGESLRQFLLKAALSKKSATALQSVTNIKLPALLARIDWQLDEPPITELRVRVQDAVGFRLEHLGDPAASIRKEAAAAALFDLVSQVGANLTRSERMLDLRMADEALARHMGQALLGTIPLLQPLLAVANSEVDQAPDGRAVASKALDTVISEAVQHEVETRFAFVIRRMTFPEAYRTNGAWPLALEILEGIYGDLPDDLARRVLFKGARTAAIRGNISDAEKLFDAGIARIGTSSSLAPEARLLAANGRLDDALRLVRDSRDSDDLAVMLGLLYQRGGAIDVTTWHDQQRVPIASFDAQGLTTLSNAYFEQERYDEGLQILEEVAHERLFQEPALLFHRGAARLASIFARNHFDEVLHEIPTVLVDFSPVLLPENLKPRLNNVLEDLRALKGIIEELELPEARSLVEKRILWCELLHIERHDEAVGELRGMTSPTGHGLDLLPFVLAFDKDYDLKALQNWLNEREALGGYSTSELKAALILKLHDMDAQGLVSFIEQYRQPLIAAFSEGWIASLEIQALTGADNPETAKATLEARGHTLIPEFQRVLNARIAAASGVDPVAELRAVYEESHSTPSLIELVRALQEKEPSEELSSRAEELFRKTADPEALLLAAHTNVLLRRDSELCRIDQEFPDVISSNPMLLRQVGWAKYRSGEMGEATKIIARINSLNHLRDLNLEAGVAIETGNWDELGPILVAYIDREPSATSGADLIKAARIGAVSGLRLLTVLVDRAVELSPDDPNVLVHAYSVVEGAGLAGRKAAARQWLDRAIEVSGDDGPIRKFSGSDVLRLSEENQSAGAQINEELAKGEMPLTVAAEWFGGSMLAAVGANLIRNFLNPDPKTKTPIPLFSARRASAALEAPSLIAIDITALQTLAWLNLLDVVVETYPRIILGGNVLGEILNGRELYRAPSHDQISRAKCILDLVGTGRLSVVPSPNTPIRALAGVNDDVALLFHTARRSGGLVTVLDPEGIESVRKKLSGPDRERAIDARSILNYLVNHGAIDAITEDASRRTIESRIPQDIAPISIDSKLPIYIDFPSLMLIQQAGLLNCLVDTFETVLIPKSAQADSGEAIGQLAIQEELDQLIGRILLAVWKGNRAGKIIFGKIQSKLTGERRGPASTFNLLQDLDGATIFVCDDRSLNNEAFAVDASAKPARMATTLDIIEDLTKLGAISSDRRAEVRRRLRKAGAQIVPFDVDELVGAARRSGSGPSAEFRRIHESLNLARAREFPRFPAEITWFASTLTTIKQAILTLWASDIEDIAKLETMSDYLFNLSPDPDQWFYAWDPKPQETWRENASTALLGGYALPVELSDPKRMEQYSSWAESRIWEPLRELNPARYEAVFAYVRAFITRWSDDDEAAA